MLFSHLATHISSRRILIRKLRKFRMLRPIQGNHSTEQLLSKGLWIRHIWIFPVHAKISLQQNVLAFGPTLQTALDVIESILAQDLERLFDPGQSAFQICEDSKYRFLPECSSYSAIVGRDPWHAE